MLLIFPPVAKPCEPPAGVALLSGALKKHGHHCTVYDANIEGLLYLINSEMTAEDSWSRRALKNREQLVADLKDPVLYRNMDRYHQRVYDLNRLLALSVDTRRFKITLSDYADNCLSSVNSVDLLKSAEQYCQNPFYPFFEHCVRKQIEGHLSPYIGISLCYLNQALVSFALAGWIKDRFPDKKIIMGGGLLSSWMRHPDYADPFAGLIDICIQGEGELPLLALMGSDGKNQRHFIPDYEFVKDGVYLSPGKVLPFRASIGCYWSKCRFCPEKAETRPYKARRASKILDDLRAVEAGHHPDYIHFIDNAIAPSFLKILSRNTFSFQWYGFVRFENELTDPEFCKKLRRSGCAMLKLGLESGDQQVLDQMNKGTCLSQVSQILENLSRAGILTFVYLLFGTESENRASAEKTLAYALDHQQYIDYLNLAVFNLPRFSPDAEKLETREFYHGDLSLYLNFKHPLGWDRSKVKKFIARQFKKQVLTGGNIRKNPAFFSSNHAAFFQKEMGDDRTDSFHRG